MKTISVSREIVASSDAVRDRILDLEAFMSAAGFDEVTVTDLEFDGGRATGGTIRIANTVGLFRIELVLSVLDRAGSVLTYEQRDGIFKTMTTGYQLTENAGETMVTVTTDFALDASFVGPIFDATVIKRQRRHEIENQFDYLQDRCE